MSKRKVHPKGPSNMKKTTYQPAIDQNGKPTLQKVPGFSGFPGWVYHPTRGFKKVSGFILPIFKAFSPTVTKEEEITESEAELTELLSASGDGVGFEPA